MIATEAEAKDYIKTLADEPAIERLSSLAALLIEEAEQQNLVSKASIPEMWRRHFADSAQLLPHVSRETVEAMDRGGVWLDLGTGAGFPGLVVAALRPEWDVRMIESRRKRIEWLERARKNLGLDKARILGCRVELAPNSPATVISARAFAPMPRLLQLSARFSTAGTLWLLPKGQSADQDLAQLPDSDRSLFHVEQSQTDSAAGIIVGQLRVGKGRKLTRNQA